MATLVVCDLCATNKHDPSVLNIRINIQGQEPLDVDFCGRHVVEFRRWLKTVDEKNPA